MPSKSLERLLGLGFKHVGDFSRDGEKIRFSLTNHKNDRGSYAFVLKGEIMYVGVTKNNLYSRMNGYRNPGPTQQTNRRIKPKIAQARRVEIYFIPEREITEFTTCIRRGKFEMQIPTDMATFERFLIGLFQPKWNRG